MFVLIGMVIVLLSVILKKVMAETVTSMKQTADVVEKSAATLQELGKLNAPIGEIIDVINDIAEVRRLEETCSCRTIGLVIS